MSVNHELRAKKIVHIFSKQANDILGCHSTVVKAESFNTKKKVLNFVPKLSFFLIPRRLVETGEGMYN